MDRHRDRSRRGADHDQPRPRGRRGPFRPRRHGASDGIPTVVDYKTGRPKDEAALRADLQLRAYAVGLAQREQTDEVAIEFHYLQGAVTRVTADKSFLRRAHGHLSATARELAVARAPDRSLRSPRAGSVSAAISAPSATRAAPLSSCEDRALFPPEEALGEKSEHQRVRREDQQRLRGRELAHP